MSLDPEMRRVLERVGFDPFAALPDLALEQALALLRQGASPPPVPAGLVARYEDRKIASPSGQLPIRIYWPEGEGPFPILMNFHGGGWVTGSVASDDLRCQRLTTQARCITISVDYRLAPEHPFPAGLDDCFFSTRWAAENAAALGADAARIAVTGASAGANLAAAVAIKGRDEKAGFPMFQLLFYPVCDGAADPSVEIPGGPFYLTRRGMEWYWHQYTARAGNRINPLASPRHLSDKAGLAPAVIIAAGLDPLAAEAKAYSAALRESGVATKYIEVPGVVHGFITLAPELRQTHEALARGAEALRHAFGTR